MSRLMKEHLTFMTQKHPVVAHVLKISRFASTDGRISLI